MSQECRTSTRYRKPICASLESAGVAVTVLIDAPNCELEEFDAWGRPDPKVWSQRFLPLRLEDFVVAADPVSEALIVARLIGSAAVGVCVADSELVPFHLRAMRKRRLSTVRSCGQIVGALRMCDLWRDFGLPLLRMVGSANFELSRSIPSFCACSVAKRISLPRPILAALDELQTKILVETLDDAAAFIGEGGCSASSTQRPDCRGGEAQTNIRRVRITRGFA